MRWHSARTLSSICTQLTELLDFCLNTTYFIYDGCFYQQTHSSAMGSPVSPIAAILYMENFEETTLSTASTPPFMWLQYVDDSLVKIHEYAMVSLSHHINNIDPHIKFTIELAVNGKLPFLDLCVNVMNDGGTKTSIYRKPTHRDQYLNFTSHWSSSDTQTIKLTGPNYMGLHMKTNKQK